MLDASTLIENHGSRFSPKTKHLQVGENPSAQVLN